jgi:hypothetical protein
MNTTAEKLDYMVRFTGDCFTLVTYVEAIDEDEAEQLAGNLILEHYGFNVQECAIEIEVDAQI